MKEYTLSKTAREIAGERGLEEGRIKQALFRPDSMDISAKNPKLRLHKKSYFHEEEGIKMTLMLFVLEEGDQLFVPFIIDSKEK